MAPTASAVYLPFQLPDCWFRGNDQANRRQMKFFDATTLKPSTGVVNQRSWLGVVAPALLVIHVIRREDRYLEGKFGQEYRDYAARVPRWLSWGSRSSNGGHAGGYSGCRFATALIIGSPGTLCLL